MRIRLLSRLALLSLALLMQPLVARAAYPDRPVHIVVGFPPGGGTDVVARVVAEHLMKSLGGSFVIFNKPGAGAMVSADYVAKSTADGYTLLLGTSGEQVISPIIYGHATYSASDFVPIAMLGLTRAILLSNPKFPGKDIRDVVAEAKLRPNQLAIATGGAGTAPDLAARELKSIAGIDVVVVPYKGAGPSQVDAIAGQVPLIFSTIASSLPLIHAQQLKPLTVIDDVRSPLLPEVPSTAELGFKGYAAATWFGLFAPVGTPPNVIATLRKAVEDALQDKTMQAKFETLGFEPASVADSSAALLKQRIVDETAHWTQFIQTANIKLE